MTNSILKQKLKRKFSPKRTELNSRIPAKYQVAGKQLDKAPPLANVYRKVYGALMKKGKVAQVPIAIIEDDDLKPQEKLLFIEITSHSFKYGFSYASDEYFGHKLNISARQISTYVQSMKEKGYLKVNTYAHQKGKRRYMHVNYAKLKEVTQKVEEKRKKWARLRSTREDW